MARSLEYWQEEFTKQLSEMNCKKVAPDEEFKHCIDRSSGGDYFDPTKAISNYGQVWSLTRKEIRTGEKHDSGYPRVSPSVESGHSEGHNILVHGLVAHYFCDDKTAVEMYGKDKKVEVDHIKRFSKLKDDPAAYPNKWDNLQWVLKADNQQKEFLQNMPRFHKKAEDYVQEGIISMADACLMGKALNVDAESEVKCKYNEDGTRTRTMKATFKGRENSNKSGAERAAKMFDDLYDRLSNADK